MKPMLLLFVNDLIFSFNKKTYSHEQVTPTLVLSNPALHFKILFKYLNKNIMIVQK